MSALPYLEILVAVVETGSFTAAADALQLSKPAVSKKITRLEQQLGTQLLLRTTRRLHLTEAGEIFVAQARQIVAQAREAEQSVQPLQAEPSGVLRITVPQSLAASLLPQTLHGFQQRYPKLNLDVQVSGQTVNLLEAGFDLALRASKLDDSSLVARRLFDFDIRVYASPEYWATHGKPTHPKDLKAHNCLIYAHSPQADQWPFQRAPGQPFNVRVQGNLRSDDAKLLTDAAVRAQGAIRVPSYVLAHITDCPLESVLDDYAVESRSVYAVYPSSQYLPQKVRVFIDYLVDAWREPAPAAV